MVRIGYKVLLAADVWTYTPRSLTTEFRPDSIAYLGKIESLYFLTEELEEIQTGYVFELGRRLGYLNVKYTTVTATAPFCPHATKAKYADKHIRAEMCTDGIGFHARYQDANNQYFMLIDTARTTSDFVMIKKVAGLDTELASEAVDLSAGWFDLLFSIKGNVLKGSRDGGSSYPISATDTAITAAGKWGFYIKRVNDEVRPISFGDPKSPSPRPVARFKVPIVGSGAVDDPFRPTMPTSIVDHPRFGKTNELALTWSAEIPTKKDGTPKEKKCRVLILDQPLRQDHLLTISEALDALRALPDVEEL